MSNLIKAYSVKYDENEKKVIDMNEKAGHFQQLYMDKILENKPQELVEKNNDFVTDEVEEAQFVEGISALTIERSSNILVEEKESSLIELDEQHRAKKLRLEEETKKILEDAKKEVKRMLAQAEVEANERKTDIYEKAKTEGYQKGKLTAQSEIEHMKKELEAERVHLQQEYEKKKKELEPAFVEMLIAFVKKFTGYAIDEKKDIILYLVEQALSGIENSNFYIIRVSKADYDMVHSKKTELLWKLKDGTDLEIIEDNLLTRGQCLIETDSRVIDCSLDVQLKNLTSDLRLLAGTSLEEELPGE